MITINLLKNVPLLGKRIKRLYWRLKEKKVVEIFPGSEKYWESRYAGGGNSGVGSYGKFAEFKAEVINQFVDRNKIDSVIEYGCGDGNQLTSMNYPNYLGFDVSETAIHKCKELFKMDGHKSFKLMDEYDNERASLTLSLDVIYHLVEEGVFETYMKRLFGSSDHYVIIYSSDTDNNAGYEGSYIKHRQFTSWVEEHSSGWKLIRVVPNRYPYKGDYREGSFADFYIYEKT
jgi:hypothetical protein